MDFTYGLFEGGTHTTQQENLLLSFVFFPLCYDRRYPRTILKHTNCMLTNSDEKSIMPRNEKRSIENKERLLNKAREIASVCVCER